MSPLLSRTAAAASAFFAFMLVTGATPALAAHRTYYVSTSGSDAAAGGTAAPFRTIQKCATVAASGDTCTIASGTYREAVKPAHDGTTFAAAPGADVLVDGTDPVSGWSQTSDGDLDALSANDKFLAGSPFASAVHDGHIYQAGVTLDPALPGNQVFMDGTLGVEAQYPYPGTNPLNPHTATAQSGTNTSITSSDLTQPAGYWVGARFTVRNWFITQTAPVTDSSPGNLTASALTGCVSLSPNQQTSFSLSGKLEELNHAGSWFYDAGAHRLYVWTPDGSPAARHTIEAKQRNWGFDLSGRSNVTLRGINVRATSIRTSATSSHNTIDGTVGTYLSAYNDTDKDPGMVSVPDSCAFLTAGETTSGIVLDGHDNTFRNGYLNWSAGNGIALLGSHNSAIDNTISNVDYLGSYAAGINLVGSDEVIQHNTVFATGRSDLNIDDKVASRVVAGSDISYNDFSDYSNLVTDDGAIYICCFDDLKGTTIHHNVLHDPNPFGASFGPGIYVDNSAFDATIYDNVAYGTTTEGLVLFNGEGSKGNRVYNNTTGTDTNAVTMFGSTYSDMVVENNIGNVDSKPGVTASHNLPYATDPLFTSPATHDFSVRAASPARNAGVVVPPATDGYRDRKPTLGAYQYGVKPWVGGATPAQTVVQAERYSDNNGVSRHYAGTGSVLGNFDGGDWASYAGVDFGAGRNVFIASVGADPAYAGKSFQIRLDSVSGPVVGTMTMPSTGGFDTYKTESVPMTTTKGVHDVYLVAASDAGPGVGNIDWFSVAKP
jgi:hypothetical protein